MAATGSAVGLGNLWKFPYVVGNYGGGAFVLVYFICMLLIGVPVMMAEVLLGREGRQSPVNAMRYIVTRSGCNNSWRYIGWVGVVAGLLILSFYAVIAGWGLEYVIHMARGNLVGVNGELAASIFSELTNSPTRLILWQTTFLSMCVLVVAGGVEKGLGAAVKILMPLLFFMLVVMLIFVILEGKLGAASKFLFVFDIDSLTWKAVLEAMGLAFFTLSIGMGAIMAYGAYMPSNISIGKTVLIVALFDSLVAIMAGLIIFAIVLSTGGIEPSAGPGLMFISLPLAFGNMPGGQLIGVVFFVLVVIAAWSSAISLLEPAVAWMMEAKDINRIKACVFLVMGVWAVGLGTVFSFNLAQDLTLRGFTIFDALDFLTSNILLPIGGFAISLFVGFAMRRDMLEKQMADLDGYGFTIHSTSHRKTYTVRTLWQWTLCYIAPCAIAAIFLTGIYEKFLL